MAYIETEFLIFLQEKNKIQTQNHDKGKRVHVCDNIDISMYIW